jgi:hypothetical protein
MSRAKLYFLKFVIAMAAAVATPWLLIHHHRWMLIQLGMLCFFAGMSFLRIGQFMSRAYHGDPNSRI